MPRCRMNRQTKSTTPFKPATRFERVLERIASQPVIRKGDRVRIKKYKTWIAWGDRTPQEFGFVTRRNGAYIYVRPRWQKHVIEFYDSELELANR